MFKFLTLLRIPPTSLVNTNTPPLDRKAYTHFELQSSWQTRHPWGSYILVLLSWRYIQPVPPN